MLALDRLPREPPSDRDCRGNVVQPHLLVLLNARRPAKQVADRPLDLTDTSCSQHQQPGDLVLCRLPTPPKTRLAGHCVTFQPE